MDERLVFFVNFFGGEASIHRRNACIVFTDQNYAGRLTVKAVDYTRLWKRWIILMANLINEVGFKSGATAVDEQIARFIYPENPLIFINDFIIEVGFRLHVIWEFTTDNIPRFESRFRRADCVIATDFLIKNELQPVFFCPIGESGGQVLQNGEMAEF